MALGAGLGAKAMASPSILWLRAKVTGSLQHTWPPQDQAASSNRTPLRHLYDSRHQTSRETDTKSDDAVGNRTMDRPDPNYVAWMEWHESIMSDTHGATKSIVSPRTHKLRLAEEMKRPLTNGKAHRRCCKTPRARLSKATTLLRDASRPPEELTSPSMLSVSSLGASEGHRPPSGPCGRLRAGCSAQDNSSLLQVAWRKTWAHPTRRAGCSARAHRTAVRATRHHRLPCCCKPFNFHSRRPRRPHRRQCRGSQRQAWPLGGFQRHHHHRRRHLCHRRLR